MKPVCFWVCMASLICICGAQNNTSLNITSRLVWGRLEDSRSTQSSAYNSVISAARNAAQTPFTAVRDIVSGNSLSNTATTKAGTFIQQAICARYELDTACLANVIQGLLIWVDTYVHVPVTANQLLLVQWLQAYDLMRPSLVNILSVDNITRLDNFTGGFISVSNYATVPIPNFALVQMYMLRAFASVILNNTTEIDISRNLLNGLASSNLFDDGTTYDYMTRDSLLQHRTALLHWVQMVTQTPTMISKTTYGRIERCVNFMRPFVNGSIAKIEYQNSTWGSDAAAKTAALVWQNSSSYLFLLQADIVFPSVYAWVIALTAIPRTSFTFNNVVFGAWRLFYNANPLRFPVIVDMTSIGESSSAIVTTTTPVSSSAIVTTTTPVTLDVTQVGASTSQSLGGGVATSSFGTVSWTVPITTGASDTIPSNTSVTIRELRPSQLTWGNLLHDSLKSNFRSYITVTARSAPYVVPALPNIFGVNSWFSADPRRIAVFTWLADLLAVSMCSKFTRNVNCTLTLQNSLMAWATTYNHSGDPETEHSLIPWIQSFDLARPVLYNTMNQSDLALLDNFLLRFIISGDSFNGSRFPDRTITNRLYIRAMASVTLGDPNLIASTKLLIESHASRNLFDNGQSWDYIARDSLDFHVINIRRWSLMAGRTPSVIAPWVRDLIEKGANFMKPFFVAPVLVHIEFLNHTMGDPADEIRKNQMLAWIPSSGHEAMRDVDCVFPSVFNWTSPIILRSTVRAVLVPQGALKIYYDQYAKLYTPEKLALMMQTPVMRPSQLVWGNLTHSSLSGTVNYFVSTVRDRAKSEIFFAIDFLELEGTLSSDPGVYLSLAADDELPLLLSFAICAKLRNNTDCINAVARGLLTWAVAYLPMGNPITEVVFISWIQAYDLVRPILFDTIPLSDISKLDTFLLLLVDASVLFDNGKIDYSNWGSWAKCLQLMGSVVSGDPILIARSSASMNDHIPNNVYQDGRSYDFVHRDAFHYHIYNLDAFLTALLQTPSLFSVDSILLVQNAVQFMQPYYTGALIHIEFANSPVAFDQARAAAGMVDYMVLPWVPATANALLQKARIVFPPVLNWTEVPGVTIISWSRTLILLRALDLYYDRKALVDPVTRMVLSTSRTALTTMTAPRTTALPVQVTTTAPRTTTALPVQVTTTAPRTTTALPVQVTTTAPRTTTALPVQVTTTAPRTTTALPVQVTTTAPKMTTTIPVTTALAPPVVFRIVITISIPVSIEAFTPVVQQGLKEVIAIAAGLTREDSYRVELIIRSAAQRRRLLTGNESVVDCVINMPNASAASAGASQLTNTTLNSGLADLGLPPATILSPPVVVTAAPETTAGVPSPAVGPTTSAAQETTLAVPLQPSFGWIQYIIVQESEGGVGFYIVSGTVLFGLVAVLIAGLNVFCGNGTQVFYYYYNYYRGVPAHASRRREIPVPIQPARFPPHDREHDEPAPDRHWHNYRYNRVPLTPSVPHCHPEPRRDTDRDHPRHPRHLVPDLDIPPAHHPRHLVPDLDIPPAHHPRHLVPDLDPPPASRHHWLIPDSDRPHHDPARSPPFSPHAHRGTRPYPPPLPRAPLAPPDRFSRHGRHDFEIPANWP